MHSFFNRLRAYCALLCVALLLSACGGGGGGGGGTTTGSPSTNVGVTPVAPPVTPVEPPVPPPPPPPPPVVLTSVTIKGTISAMDTASVDADINDVNARYVSNDTFVLAQPLINPVLLTGHLTLKGEAPAGPNNTYGDLVDHYRVRLSAGQTIELDFSADPTVFDIDLHLYDVNTEEMAGASFGTKRYECLRITTEGEYFISALVYRDSTANSSRGHSVYQLRITAPNSSNANCPNVSRQLASVVPGEIIARVADPVASPGTRTAAVASPKAAAQDLGLALLAGNAQDRPALFGLAATSAARSSAIKRLGAGPAVSGKAQAAVSAYATLDYPGLPAATRSVLETIATAKAMKNSGLFAYAFPNQRMQSTQTTPLVGDLPSNDRDYASQRWHYDMISLPQAMQTLVGMSPQPSQRPIVAVIDTGIVANHPDLSANIIGGYDFISDAGRAADGNGIDPNPDDSAPASTNPSFHGSHVAGTVAAQGFNGTGGLGVAPMAQIMPLRVLGVGGSGTFYDILNAVLYAAGLPNDSGTVPPRRADVINLSLGGTGACDADVVRIFSAIRTKGTVVVAASGNDSGSSSLAPVIFPANCPGVLAVGATDALRGRAFYSNGGPALAVVAPGGDLRRSTTGNGAPDGIYSTLAQFQSGTRVPTYSYYMGTSMATPHAAGIVALMRWVNPNLSATAIEDLIRGGTLSDDLGATGRDNTFGQGLFNAKRAVDAAIRSTGAPLPNGRVEASPMNISLGSVRSQADLLVQRVGTTTEAVSSVVSDSAAVVVSRVAVNASGLGTYRVTADRSKLTEGQMVFAKVVVTLVGGRTITVVVDVEQRTLVPSGSGSFGPIYVLALNADSGNQEVLAQTVVAQPVRGSYTYSVKVDAVPGRTLPQKAYIFAGADLDNDSNICRNGEACGAYPLLGSQLVPIALTSAEVTGINFDVSPFGGINPTALGRTLLGGDSQAGGLRFTKPAPVAYPGLVVGK